MNKRNFTIIGLSALIAVLIIVLSIFVYKGNVSNEKTGYIAITKVYNGFTLKKQYEASFNTIKNARNTILDSLKLQLESLSKQITNKPVKNEQIIVAFKQKKDEYLSKCKEFEQRNTALSNKYTSEIFEQINQYIKDYGVSNGYTYIFGANDEGTLMYAKESKDISDDVIIYINSRFKGKQVN